MGFRSRHYTWKVSKDFLTKKEEENITDSLNQSSSYLKSCEIVKILKTFVKPHKDSGQTSGNEVYNVEETAERFNEAVSS